MLAQILGTFGLALVLRYAAFWAFTANFVSLPDNLVGGTFAVAGLRIEASRLLGGVLALVITIGMHLVLTRTMLGSRILAVAEDRNAAMLMGIRPDRMQALAWGVGAASTGVAGALIALFFYISPTVGESLALIAFVVVCLGGFGSVPGALVAGLAIGVIQALSAYLIGAVYQDVGGLCPVPAGAVGAAARLAGHDMSESDRKAERHPREEPGSPPPARGGGVRFVAGMTIARVVIVVGFVLLFAAGRC